MSDLPRTNQRWPGFVALLALAISLVALWTGFAARSISEIPNVQAAQFTVRYMERGMSHSWGPIETIIPVADGFDKTYEFSKLDRDYTLRLSSKMDRLKTVNYDVQFCQMVENECINIDVPSISIVPGQARRMHTRERSAIGPNGELIELRIGVEPTPVSREVKASP